MAGPQSCDLVVTNGYVLTLDKDRRVFPQGALAIKGGRIAAVGRAQDIARAWRAGRTIDARGATVHPGFIDAHVHIVHGTCRGIFGERPQAKAPNVNFADWKADVTPDDEHAATAFAALELLRNGFTCFIEPGSAFDTDAVAAACDAVGVRALLAGCYLWDQIEIMSTLGKLDSKRMYERAPANLDRCLKELGRELHRNKDPDALVRGYVAIYGLGTASDELERAAASLARQHGVAFQQHDGYTPESHAADRARLGRTRLSHLMEMGVIGEGASLVHMNLIDDSDEAALLKTGATLVWCPHAYFGLGAAARVRPKIPALYKRGMNVALAVDGTMDIRLGEAAMGAFCMARQEGIAIEPEDLIEMQSIRAAKAAGLEAEIGSLEAGKRADVVVRRADAAETYPGVNPVHQLALMAREGSADTVIVAGRVVLRDGRSTRMDDGAVLAEARASVLRRMNRLGLTASLRWPVAA